MGLYTGHCLCGAVSYQIQGEPREYTRTADSGNQVRRRFCAQCGSHVFADSIGHKLGPPLSRLND